jgi:hypothetical protein
VNDLFDQLANELRASTRVLMRAGLLAIPPAEMWDFNRLNGGIRSKPIRSTCSRWFRK